MSGSWWQLPSWSTPWRRLLGATLLVLTAALFHIACVPAGEPHPHSTATAAANSHEHEHDGDHNPSCHQSDQTATSLSVSRAADRAQSAPDVHGDTAEHPVTGYSPGLWPALVRAAADPSPSRPLSGRALLRETEISRT